MADQLSQLKRIQAEAQALIDDQEVAAQDPERLHRWRKFVHFWAMVIRSFVNNRCPIRATALAYTTLLALVPMLAVGLGVATSFLKTDAQKTEILVEQMVDQLAPQLEMFPQNAEDTGGGPAAASVDNRRRVVSAILGFIRNINSGALGVTGTAALILVAVGLLSTIEKTFNDIWGINRGRTWFVRVIRYWAAVTLGPLILLLAMTLAIGGQMQSVHDVIQGLLGKVLTGVIFDLLPLLILSASFGLLYQLMPHTSVSWKAALVGGLVAGLLWALNSKLNVFFTGRVVSASKIYGPLGVVPVFLVGLYISWLILLFGAQVSYGFQNRRAYLQERQAAAVHQRGREFVALRLMTMLGQRFHQGESPPTLTELADAIGASSRLLGQVLDRMKRAGLVVEVNQPQPAYSLGRPLERITCGDILEELRAGEGRMPPTREDQARAAVRGVYSGIIDEEQRSARSVTLLSMIERLEKG